MPRKPGYHIRSARLEQPTESWWATATTWEDFTRRAAEAAPRMAGMNIGAPEPVPAEATDAPT